MQIIISEIRFSGLNVAKGVRAELVSEVVIPDVVIPAREIPEQIIPAHPAVLGEMVPEQIIPEHTDESGEIIPEQIIPAHPSVGDELVPEQIIPAYTLPEQHVSQGTTMEIAGYVWQYNCTFNLIPCSGVKPNFEEITGESRYILEKVLGFESSINKSLELPSDSEGGEPAIPILGKEVMTWFGGEMLKAKTQWVGKNISINVE